MNFLDVVGLRQIIGFCTVNSERQTPQVNDFEAFSTKQNQA